MENLDTLTPSQDERVMAGLSHISILFPMMGMIAPIVIWVTQKEKSRYVAFQSLQAVAYQLCMMVAWLIGMACYIVPFFAMFFTIPFVESAENSRSFFPIFGFSFITPFIVMGATFFCQFWFIVFGVIGAVKAFQGKPFRYALIGRSVERFMKPKNEVETTQ